MADCDKAKSDFHAILLNVERKFEVMHVKWNDHKCFEAKFRTQIPRNNEDFNALCDEWVEKFSNITNTVWVKKISNTGPKIRFRKQYQCWPQNGKDVKKELLFDARRCRGTLDIKVLTDNPLTRKKNKHIRNGLNVVVKINFTHLHRVDTAQHFAFFIHMCEPQLQPPKPVVHTDSSKLSQKVAEIVQKGLNACPKVVPINAPTLAEKLITDSIDPIQSEQFLQPTHLSVLNMESLALNQIPVQNTPDGKLEVQPQLQQLTQVVVSTTPQLDMNEPLFMCQQTLMFDPMQIIPVTTHHIPHHFVQLHHNISNQHGHYL